MSLISRFRVGSSPPLLPLLPVGDIKEVLDESCTLLPRKLAALLRAAAEDNGELAAAANWALKSIKKVIIIIIVFFLHTYLTKD